ncbi:MAG: hypothetical protein AAFQ80_08180 [Cyanobacteria bacterium J06621_8]
MQIRIKVYPRTIVRYLVIIIIFFAVVSTGIQICKYVFDYRDDWMKVFNLDRELNLPTWYSALMLGFCSLLLRFIALGKKQQGDRYTRDWRLLSVIFSLMAIDEVVSLHEILIIPEVSEALNLPWFLHSMWVIPGTVFVVWFGNRYRQFLANLPSSFGRQFTLAALVYIGGALIMEMIGSHVAESLGQQTLIYALIATIEEIMEMSGVVIFMAGLFRYLKTWAGNLELQLDIF